MNFYARQASARQRTRLLVVLFAIAVLTIVVFLNLVVLAVVAGSGEYDRAYGAHPNYGGIVLAVTLTVLAVIGLSSLYKTAALRGGGGVVARSMGATRIDRSQG